MGLKPLLLARVIQTLLDTLILRVRRPRVSTTLEGFSNQINAVFCRRKCVAQNATLAGGRSHYQRVEVISLGLWWPRDRATPKVYDFVSGT